MKNSATPFQLAEICYNPAWPNKPWYIIRTGAVAEQGGLAFGQESVSFELLEDALNYLKYTIKRDMPIYKEKAEEILKKMKKDENT